MRESAALVEPFSAASFRQVLANLASGVTVITAYSAAGPLGLAATSRPAGANARCADVAMRVARRRFSHVSAQSDSDSRCPDFK